MLHFFWDTLYFVLSDLNSEFCFRKLFKMASEGHFIKWLFMTKVGIGRHVCKIANFNWNSFVGSARSSNNSTNMPGLISLADIGGKSNVFECFANAPLLTSPINPLWEGGKIQICYFHISSHSESHTYTQAHAKICTQTRIYAQTQIHKHTRTQ